MGQQHTLAPVAGIHLVPCLQGLAPDQGLVSGLLRQADGLRRAEALRPADVQKGHIILAVGLHISKLRRIHPVKAVFPAAQQFFLQCLVGIRHVLFLLNWTYSMRLPPPDRFFRCFPAAPEMPAVRVSGIQISAKKTQPQLHCAASFFSSRSSPMRRPKNTRAVSRKASGVSAVLLSS